MSYGTLRSFVCLFRPLGGKFAWTFLVKVLPVCLVVQPPDLAISLIQRATFGVQAR
jgi:hypothetical protein